MSSPRRRAAFDPTALDDIDDLLPILSAPEGDPPDPSGAGAPVVPPVQRLAPPGERSTSAAHPVPAAPRRIPPPEVSLAPEVYAALRALTLRERAASPTTARTYGRVALDAIETHAGALQHHWDTPPPTDTGLFSSANTAITSRRRRHAQAPARVPLAGILASDATQLDHLAEAWGAGSRSALVEAALRLYLRLV